MPRDAYGVYSLPAAYLAVTGDVITALQHNGPLEDVAAALTNSISRDGRTAITANIPFANYRLTNVGDPVDDTDAVNKRFAARQFPTGAISMVVGTAAPAGFLKADGSPLNRVTYADLWAYAQASGAIVSDAAWASNSWGCFSTGDGATTFRLPDLRGEFLRGWDNGRGVDGGRGFGVYQGSQNLSHAHSIADPGHAHGVYDPGHQHSTVGPQESTQFANPGAYFGYQSSTGFVSSTSGNGTGIAIYGAGTGIGIYADGGGEARPRNIPLLACIKY